jgi:hypothetical protein
MIKTPGSAEQLTEAIAALQSLTSDDLRQRWEANFKAAPPSRASREFLERSLLYRIQEQAFGGLPPRVKKRLQRLQRELQKDPGFAPAPTPTFKPGTRLIRQWKGKVHEVEILESGFAWGGQHYSSLSRIARTITGTRWSGPVFFGLKKRSQRD